MQKVAEALQKARADLMKGEEPQCRQMKNALAHPAEPYSQCGAVATPRISRSIARQDLYCDTISWQFFEMGNSDNFRAQCPKHPAAPAPWVRA